MEATVKEKNIYVSTINKPEPSTKMTKEEFYAMIDKSIAQYERGEYYTMLPNESLDDFLDRVDNGKI